MKKKISIVILFVMIAFVFAACNKGNGEVNPSSGDNATVTEAPTQTGDAAENDNKKDDKNDSGKNDSGKNDSGKNDSDKDNPGKNDSGKKDSDKKDDTPIVTAEPTPVTSYEAKEVVVSKANDITDVSLTFNADGTYEFGEDSTLYSNDLTLTVSAPQGAKIYYTLDGTNPTTESTQYTEPLSFKAHGGDFPDAYIFRAIAVYSDNTQSKTAVRTYLTASKLEGRFSTIIFSVTGNPDELTDGPEGIFYGENYKQRGRESERAVYVEAWSADGTSLLSQFAGVRIYGGYSRQTSIKSMKLFSRSSYDPDNKNFKFSEFGTEKLDGSDKIIKKYDKLVLRNFGNDMQFGFIRDELSQALCKVAGFECYEAVIPAIAYLNGEYYGFYWLHENYCDKYFKEKYGNAEGEFVILEGSEKDKNDDDEYQYLVDEYNTKYDEFVNMDLTDDANYAKLCEFMDVEDYLDYFAWNITINNWDWPNNNYKCYKYVEADAAALKVEGAAVTPDNEVYDGRWRFLVHDMDYTYGIYDQYNAKASYNNFSVIMNKNDNRYAPLFTHLMDRKDCRSYFRSKVYEYINGAFSPETIIETYKTLNAEREQELMYFYDYIQQLNRKGDWSMWTNAGNYAGVETQIINFANGRANYVKKYLEKFLPELE